MTEGEGNTVKESSREKYYKVKEIAAILALSPNTVRREFRDEPDVIKYGRAETRSKRKYITLRIPESAFRRVEARLRANGKLRKPPGRARS